MPNKITSKIYQYYPYANIFKYPGIRVSLGSEFTK